MKRMQTFILSCAVAAMSWQPIFEEYKTIQIGGNDFKDIPVNLWGDNKFRGYPAPSFSDWDGDGKKDLVVGIYDKGAIMVSENVGTVKEPAFNDFKYLHNEGHGVSFANAL